MSSQNAADLAALLKESLAKGVVARLTVTSDSMAPLLEAGDEIGVASAAPQALTRGCIITYAYPTASAGLITHRLASVTMDGKTGKVTTWADRTLRFDRPAPIEQVIGMVVWRQRGDRVLSLLDGSGAWLNEKLALLAARELALISGLRVDSMELTPELMDHANAIRDARKRLPQVRLLRRAVRLWAAVLHAYGGRGQTLVSETTRRAF